MPHRWSNAAQTRKRQIESGLDLTFSRVFLPYFVEQFGSLNAPRILEVGAGTGHLALALHHLASSYVAIEPSRGMASVARSVLKHTDVEFKEELLTTNSVGEGFDVVVSHMCLHAIEDLRSFLPLARHQLKKDGRYFFSLPHPAFYNDYKQFIDPKSYRYLEEMRAQVSFAISLDPHGAINEVPYHHRPLSTYISSLTNSGLRIDHLDEIYPSPDVECLYPAPWKVPRYMVLRGSRDG